MLVERTTLRVPPGARDNAASCASADRSPNRGHICTRWSTPIFSFSSDCTLRISRAPGRNTSTSPCSSRKARRTSPATRCSGDSAIPPAGRGAPGSQGSTGIPLPPNRVSTGNIRPCAVTMGASPNTFATASPSRVADIIKILRSDDRLSRPSSASASPRSA